MFYAEDAASRPASRWDPVPVEDRSRPQQSFLDPAYLAGAVWKARHKILVLGVLGALAAGAFALSQPKQYTATAQIVLDPRELNLVQNELTPTANGLNTDAALALVESQISVMTSNSVLLRVVREANLTADTEFNGLRQTWLGGLSATLAALLSDDPVKAADSRELRTVTNFWRHISAVRNANSFVINVSVESEDPEKSAYLANLTTQIFIAEQGRAQSELARRATTALSSRLAELRARVVEAEDGAEAYKAQNQLVGVGGRLIDDDYITRVNNQLADVRSQITSLNVRARSLREASVEDIAAGSFPEGLNSEALLRLRQVYSEAAQNQAILSSRLGPRHPQRMAADQAVATARRAIETEMSRIVTSAQTELARAQATERDLSGQIETLRSRQIETSGAFVRLRELEREVDASRAVYEAYLLRARQTGEQESLNTSNVRVISDATVPFNPSSLSRKLVVILGFVGGLGLAIGLALVAAVVRSLRGAATPAAVAAVRVAGVSGRFQSSYAGAGMAFAPVAGMAAGASMAEGLQRPLAETPPPPAPEPVAAPTLDTREGDWSLRGGSFDGAGTDEPQDDPKQDTILAPKADTTAPGEAAEAGAEAPEAEVADEHAAIAKDDADAAAEPSDGTEPVADAEREQTPAADEPAVPVAAMDGLSEIEARREALRQRIRELGASRVGRVMTAPEMAPSVEAVSADERRERISLRLAAARSRRSDASQAGVATEADRG